MLASFKSNSNHVLSAVYIGICSLIPKAIQARSPKDKPLCCRGNCNSTTFLACSKSNGTILPIISEIKVSAS